MWYRAFQDGPRAETRSGPVAARHALLRGAAIRTRATTMHGTRAATILPIKISEWLAAAGATRRTF
jgi:hypothetical protein